MSSSFLDLHVPGSPLLLPNAWDAGSAKILASLGYSALATTSSGYAATLGRFDGDVHREEAITHAGELAQAVSVPVSADFENGFSDKPQRVAELIGLSRDIGLAGCSIEDYCPGADDPIYEAGLAKERIAAAVEASGDLVLTARCENYLHGRRDLAETIARLQAYQEAGADVLFAPGVTDLDELKTLCAEVDRPVNALILDSAMTPAALAEVGVARISVGGAFAWNAYSGLVKAGRKLLDGDTSYLDKMKPASEVIDEAFR